MRPNASNTTKVDLMRFDSAKATYVLGVLFVAAGLWELDEIVLGDGRSLLAYLIGAAAILGCLLTIVVVLTVLGWLADRISNWRR